MTRGDLEGQHVVVTGGSRGIGSQLVQQALAAGARVTSVSRGAPPAGAEHVVADLADRTHLDELLARVEAEHGPVDVLVLNAGVDGAGSLLDVSADDVREVVDVNLAAPLELARQAVGLMVPRGRGRLVLLSSGYSTVAAQGLATYCATKAGLSHFATALRLELAGTGVGVTLVEPGPVRTQMLGAIEEDGPAAAAVHRLVRLRLTRYATPEEVAAQTWAGVASGRRHVVVPRRMVSALAFAWLPRRVGELALTGTRRR